MKITKRQLRRIIKEAIGHDSHIDLYLDLGSDGDFPTLNDGDSYKQWEVPYFTSAEDFLDEVLSQLPGSTPDTIVVGVEMDLPDLPLSRVWDTVMAAGRIIEEALTSSIDHQFNKAFEQMYAFEADPSDIADMEEIRDLYYQDLPKGEASPYLKRLAGSVDTIIREQIPQDVYYWIFPNL